MPFEIQVKNQGREIWAIYTGTITREEIDASWEQRLADDEAFSRVHFLVADYTDASLAELDTDEVKALSRWPQMAAHINSHITIVALMAKDLHYGLSRIWRAHCDFDSLPWDMVYVNSRQELDEYLGGQTDLSASASKIRSPDQMAAAEPGTAIKNGISSPQKNH